MAAAATVARSVRVIVVGDNPEALGGEVKRQNLAGTSDVGTPLRSILLQAQSIAKLWCSLWCTASCRQQTLPGLGCVTQLAVGLVREQIIVRNKSPLLVLRKTWCQNYCSSLHRSPSASQHVGVLLVEAYQASAEHHAKVERGYEIVLDLLPFGQQHYVFVVAERSARSQHVGHHS